MNNKNFINHIHSLLKGNEKYLDNEGDLLVDEVRRLANKYDESLLTLLYSDVKARDTFFLKVGNTTVFKQNDFDFFLEEKLIDNSYTAYENRIGLTSGNRMLKDVNDVVLNFPYKDCILEGGQSTEEGLDTYFEYTDKTEEYEEKQSKRKEIFFNQALAKDEIDRLTEPKAFENIKRYTKDGEEEAKEFNRNEEGTITDNLIIKGNNLLALHSLLPEFEGKVKLIYIDPPFNTGNDSFKYNDNFNHSSWLVFMKNRLEIAKKLLSMDGNIFIHIDINETHYLKILCDNVFKRENFVEEIIWAYGSPSGGRAAGAKPVNIHDTILHYSKDYSSRKQNKIFTPYSDKYINDWFKYYDEEDNNRQYRRRMRGKNDNGESVWEKQYLDESKGMPLTTVWTDIKQIYADPRAYKENQSHTTELLKEFSGGQKPEQLLKRIIEMTTDEGDIVLDYHIGTGSTMATAHKMKRQYIGIEQMDYIENLVVNRLINIIEGNQTGISKAVDWKGGGSFVYMELAKNNQKAIDHIENCQSYDELVAFFDEMCDTYFLDYNLKIKEFKETVSKEDNFKSLSLDQQKKMFAKMLDLNQLYVNVSDMEDAKFKLSNKDIQATKDFYKK